MSAPGEFRMPSLGADMDEGRLVEWRVRPGDAVRRGDLVAVIDTPKAAVEVEIWENGVVAELCVQPGTTVPVGTLLARLAPAGGAAPVAPAPVAPEPVALPTPPVPLPPDGHPLASPYARRRARELGVDLARVAGTGRHGTIHAADVERAAAAAAPAAPAAPARAGDERQRAMREAIARAMARSKREIPHYYLATEVDLGPALEWLQRENAARPIAARILPAALLLRAIALAVAEVPEVNGFFREGAFAPSAAVHLGVAISLREGGLISPALLDAQDKPVATLMRELSDLVVRARQGGLRGREMTAATLTVTNLGDLGVGSVFGVIHPPQVALVGIGRIEQRPRVVGGAVVARPVVTLTLSADHRVGDGHRGGRYLAAVARRLEKLEGLT
jgi:pyruvate dehydrogenase E2 component (dihydrolipoamide acetyltransferase)